MVEFTKEETIPPIEGTFKPSEETLEVAAILDSLDIGEVIRFPVSGNQPVRDRINESNKVKCRAQSAAKRAQGRYKIAIRHGDVWVERLD